jgi:dCMP deaminase
MIYDRSQLDKWDLRMLELAEHVATWSKDPSTRVGTVIAQPDRRVASMGYNGFPRGVDDLPERYADRDVKMRFVCHAERNALDNAELSVRGCTMYVTLQPCADCTKSMIQRGIKRVVTKVNLNREQYYKDFVDHSLSMLEEAGVEVMQVKD